MSISQLYQVLGPNLEYPLLYEPQTAGLIFFAPLGRKKSLAIHPNNTSYRFKSLGLSIKKQSVIREISAWLNKIIFPWSLTMDE